VIKDPWFHPSLSTDGIAKRLERVGIIMVECGESTARVENVLAEHYHQPHPIAGMQQSSPPDLKVQRL